jgi:hypothetical protein
MGLCAYTVGPLWDKYTVGPLWDKYTQKVRKTLFGYMHTAIEHGIPGFSTMENVVELKPRACCMRKHNDNVPQRVLDDNMVQAVSMEDITL